MNIILVVIIIKVWEEEKWWLISLLGKKKEECFFMWFNIEDNNGFIKNIFKDFMYFWYICDKYMFWIIWKYFLFFNDFYII